MHVRTECVENVLIRSKLDEDPIKKRETSVTAVQPRACQKTREEVSTIEEFFVELSKDASCLQETTQVGMSESFSSRDFTIIFVQHGQSTTAYRK